MLGRQNKNLVIRLVKVTEPPVYHIVVARKRSKPLSRLDRIGSIAVRTPYTFLKLDIQKLTKYLREKNVTIAAVVWKYLNLDVHIVKNLKKKRNAPVAYT
jgi:hypothetical protein